MVVSFQEPAGVLVWRRRLRGPFSITGTPLMKPASPDGMPGDVLIVEDDPIIALDFEDTILGLGVKTVRTAGSVARYRSTSSRTSNAWASPTITKVRSPGGAKRSR